jgi:putative ABC transport system permease protein
MLLTTISMALREIRRNGLRSLLTMLGVVIGVGAVIALVSVGRGATQKVTEDIGRLGKNLLTVSAGTFSRGGGGSSINAPPLRLDDAHAIAQELLGLQAVAAAAVTTAQVIYGNSNQRTQVTGSDNAFFEVRGYGLAQGRSFSRAELQSGASVCVIGSTVRNNLFQNGNPIGASIRVGNVSCPIVGVLASKGQAGMGQDQDDLVVMPLKTVQRRLTGNENIQTIFVSAREGQATGIVAERLRGLLRQRRHRSPELDDDFTIRDMAEIAQTVMGASNALTALLGAIAAVSLIVGGIGIMNIMLVSVTERTREIGIRLAIGAFGGEVMLQFLLEAIVLSTLGGVVGIVLGVSGSYFAARAMSLPFVPAPDVVLLAFAFSAVVGVVFGFLPARKAAELDPIEALRHE